MKLAVRLSAARHIKAEPEKAWRAFLSLAGIPQNPSQAGFTPSMRPLRPARPITARLLEFEPPRLACWRLDWLGLAFSERFSFSPVQGGVMVKQSQVIEGWPLIFLRPLYSPSKLAPAMQKWLKDLAALAEGR